MTAGDSDSMTFVMQEAAFPCPVALSGLALLIAFLKSLYQNVLLAEEYLGKGLLITPLLPGSDPAAKTSCSYLFQR